MCCILCLFIVHLHAYVDLFAGAFFLIGFDDDFSGGARWGPEFFTYGLEIVVLSIKLTIYPSR